MPYAPEVVAAAVAIAAIAGVVRGITGFGGAMVMSPPLALLLGPLLAVPVALLLEGFAGANLLAQTRRQVRWRTIGPIVAAAVAMTPVGAFALASLDPLLLRRVIAGVVIAFALLLLAGWRYTGRQRLATSAAVGALGGSMIGATSMAGPPVVLYLLSGPDSIETTRANMTLFTAAISLAALAALWASGVLGVGALVFGLVLAPGYFGGIVLGARAFSRFNDTRFRRFTLLLMIAVSAAILLA